jgi:hypothetical protein
VIQPMAGVLRLFMDIFFLGPGLFAIVLLGRLWDGVKDYLFLHLTGRILTAVSVLWALGDHAKSDLSKIETGTRTGNYNSKEVYWAVGAHMTCTMVSSITDWLVSVP